MKLAPTFLATILAAVLTTGCGHSGSAGGPAVDPAITAMLPDDAVMAVVAYPKRVLETAPRLKPFLDDMQSEIGVAPLDVEQVTMISGFPPPGPRLQGAHPFETAIVLRMAAPHGGEKFVASFLAPAKPEKVEAGGKTLYRPSKDGPRAPFGRPHCILLLDDRSLIAGDEDDLREMLAVTQVKTPLAKLLGSVDASDDVTVALANNDVFTKSFDDAKQKGDLPPQLMAFGDLPDQVQSVLLTVKAAPELSLKVVAETKDAAAAEKVVAAVAPAKQMLTAMSAGLRGSALPAAPKEQKGLLEFALGKLDKLVAGLTPKADGSRVTLQIDGLGTVDEWAAKAEPPMIAAREASRRAALLNNLRQLALAMSIYQDQMGTLPPRAIFSKDGKPLLSWRVALLPYLDQQELYQQFHLDEPWDSEHNKPLIAKMPAVFTHSRDASPGDGRTRYLVPTGKDTVFDGDKGIRYAEITDGLSNTLLIVEVAADKAVVWTKPEDLQFDPQQPLAGIGTIADEAFAAAFCDGRVQLIRKDVPAETFRRLILRNDGQPIDMSSF